MKKFIKLVLVASVFMVILIQGSKVVLNNLDKQSDHEMEVIQSLQN